MAKIVVVEDEVELAAAIAARLRSDGHCVSVAEDGPGAVQTVTSFRPDMVILDLMLPGFDGLEVCRRIQRDRQVPVIMLTARDSETDRVVGLEVGADDYLGKPFSMRELTARVRALLRRVERSAAVPDRVLRVGDLEIDVARRRARLRGKLIGLTATEFDLLVYLLLSPGVVRTRPDGTILATADLHGHVYLWNIVTGRRIATLSDPSGNPPDAIAFSPDGSIIAVGDDNKNAPGTPAGVFLFKVNERPSGYDRQARERRLR